MTYYLKYCIALVLICLESSSYFNARYLKQFSKTLIGLFYYVYDFLMSKKSCTRFKAVAKCSYMNASLHQALKRRPSCSRCHQQRCRTRWPKRAAQGAWSAAPATIPLVCSTARPGSGAYAETTSNTALIFSRNSWGKNGSARTCMPRSTLTTLTSASG